MAGPITHCRSPHQGTASDPDPASANPAMEGRTAYHSPAAPQHAANNLHIHSRRTGCTRPKDHGSLWYPTHSTASESLPRAPHGQHGAECRVNLRAGRCQTTWRARGPLFCLHVSTARARRRDNQSWSPPTVPLGRTARQPVPSNSAPWMLQKPRRSGDSDTS